MNYRMLGFDIGGTSGVDAGKVSIRWDGIYSRWFHRIESGRPLVTGVRNGPVSARKLIYFSGIEWEEWTLVENLMVVYK